MKDHEAMINTLDNTSSDCDAELYTFFTQISASVQQLSHTTNRLREIAERTKKRLETKKLNHPKASVEINPHTFNRKRY